MAEAKRTYEKGSTPKGIAVFPRLDKPDYKFKKDLGEYSVKLRLSAEDAEALRKKLQAALDKHLEEVRKEYEEKAKTAKTGKEKAAAKKFLSDMPVNDLPIKEAVDDEGEPTGEYEVTFKAPGAYKDKSGKIKPRKITFVDASGKELKGTPSIWGGSELRIGYTIRPYTTPKGVGIRLGLELVKIIKLVTGGSGASASDFGLDDEEEGYVDDTTEDTTSEFEETTEAGDETDPDEDNPDF